MEYLRVAGRGGVCWWGLGGVFARAGRGWGVLVRGVGLGPGQAVAPQHTRHTALPDTHTTHLPHHSHPHTNHAALAHTPCHTPPTHLRRVLQLVGLDHDVADVAKRPAGGGVWVVVVWGMGVKPRAGSARAAPVAARGGGSGPPPAPATTTPSPSHPTPPHPTATPHTRRPHKTRPAPTPPAARPHLFMRGGQVMMRALGSA